MAYAVILIGTLHIIGFFLYLHFLGLVIAMHYNHCEHKETCALVNISTTQAYFEASLWPIFTIVWEVRRWNLSK